MKPRSLGTSDIAIIIGIAGIVVLLASLANAAPVCRVQRVVSPYVAQLAVAPNVYYQVGQSLQREAVDTQQFRHSEEYIELQQLRGFKAGVDAVTASAVTTSGPPQPATGHPATTEEGQNTPPATPELPVEPGSEKWVAFKEKFPITAATCAGCHGRKNPDKPDGDLFLNGDMTLEGQDGELRRFQMLKKVYNGHMPPGNPLSDEQYSAFQQEMLTEEK